MTRAMKKVILLTPLLGLGLVAIVAMRCQSPRSQETAMPKAKHGISSQSTTQAQVLLDAALTKEGSSALDAFDTWLDTYRGPGKQLSAASITEGEALAAARRPIMQGLIKSDPKQALASAVRWDQYVALPASVRKWVEEPFSEVAQWSVLPICNSSPNGHQGNIVSMVRNSDGVIEEWSVTPYGRRLGVTSKSDAGLQGIRLGKDAAVREEVFELLSPLEYSAAQTLFPVANKNPKLSAANSVLLPSEPVAALAGGEIYLFADSAELARAEETLRKAEARPGHLSGTSLLRSPLADSGDAAPTLDLPAIEAAAATASSTWTESPKTVLCIVVDFSDKPGAPVAMSDLISMVSGAVKSNIEAFSFGKTTLIPTAAAQAVYRMPQPSTYYAPSNDSQLHTDAQALAKASGSVPANFDLTLVYFANIGRAYAGLADVGGPKVWIQNANNARVITHEFGHSYGVGHANYWNCNDGTVIGPNGTHIEYGDIYDVMGSGSSPTGHFNPRFKRYLNWITTAQQTDVTATTGTYRVYASDNSTSSSNPTMALRVKKDASNTYIVGLKSAIANTSLQNGLYILWDNNTGYSTRLLDMTPDSASGDADKQDAALALSRTFTDPTGLVNITPVAKGGSGASAWMDVSVVLGIPGNRPPTISISGNSTAQARSSVSFTANAADPDGDTLYYSWDFGSGSSPGTATSSFKYPTAGNYTVTVTATDAKGGTVSANKTISVSDPLLAWTPVSLGFSGSPGRGIYQGGRWVVDSESGSIIYFSPDGTTWSRIDVPYGMARGAAFGNNRFVLARSEYNYGTTNWSASILHSPNGQVWTAATIPASGGLNGIAFGNGIFVVTTDDGGVLVSADGIMWTRHLPYLGGRKLHEIAFGSGFFIATTDAAGLLRSNDGVSWSSLDEMTNDFFIKVTFDAGNFAALATGSSFVSSDGGATWTAGSWPTGVFPITLAGGSGVFAALGSKYNSSNSTTDYSLLLSADGLTWGSVPVTDGADEGLVIGNGRILRIDSDSPGGMTLSGSAFIDNLAPAATIQAPVSPAARTTQVFSISTTDADGDSVSLVWDFGDGSAFLSSAAAVTHTYLSGGNFTVKIYAADGRGAITTAQQSVSVTDSFASGTSPTSGTTASLYDAVWTGSQFVAVGNSGGTVLRSADGITWAKVTKGGNYYLYGLCWTGSQLVAVGMDYDISISSWIGVVLTSPDAITWTERLRGGKPLKDVACGTSGLVAVGESGRAVYSSLSATAWSEAATGSTNTLSNIVYNGSAFSLADGFTLRTSADGAAWTGLPTGSGAPSWISKLIYTNGRYYALNGASIYSSADAVSWSKATLPSSVSANTLTVCDGFLYVTGRENINSTYVQKDFLSLDGVTWASVTTSSTITRNAALYVQGRILTFGDSGSIQRSGLYTRPTGYTYWTKDYFPAGGELSGCQADPDRDTIPNLMEYALGTHPTDSESKIIPVFENHFRTLSLSIPRSAKRSDIFYVIEQSEDLINWLPTGLTITSDTDTLLRGELPIPVSGKAFLRLNISRPTSP